jgi:hypothetical protein
MFDDVDLAEPHVHVIIGPNVYGCARLLVRLQRLYGFNWDFDLVLSLVSSQLIVTLTGFDEKNIKTVVRVLNAHWLLGFVRVAYVCK